MLLQPTFRQSPFAFPVGRASGFDPTHIAASRVRFSGIPLGSNAINLLNGKPGAPSGSPLPGSSILSIGPTASFGSVASTVVNFSGQSTANDTAVTLAAFIMPTAFTGSPNIFASASTNAGWRLGLNTSARLLLTAGNVSTITSTVALAAGVPYFVAASVAGASGTLNFIAINLNTGVLQTQATTGPTSSAASNGTYQIGNDFAATQSANGALGPVMFSAQFMSLAALQMWAADPWSFWYPPQRRSFVGVTAVAPSFLAAWALNRNVAVEGIAT